MQNDSLSLLTKKQFAGLCGKNTSYLAIYIMRKQVLVTEDGRIDIREDLNKAFLQKRAGKDYDLILALENELSAGQSPAEETSVFQQHNQLITASFKKCLAERFLKLLRTNSQITPQETSRIVAELIDYLGFSINQASRISEMLLRNITEEQVRKIGG